MLRQYQASLDDRKIFTALVKDLFPDQAKNVNLLLMAYNMGIAKDIQTASYINNTFAFRYVKQLMSWTEELKGEIWTRIVKEKIRK